MPILDGSLADHYHRQDRIQVTRRITSELSVTDASQLPAWFQAPKVYLHYHREAHRLANFTSGRAVRLIQKLGLTPSHDVLLVGSGFAWVAEEMKRLGISVTSMDNSSWIHAVKGEDEVGEIEAALDLAGVTAETDTTSEHPLRAAFLGKLLAGRRATETILEEDALSKSSRQRIRNAGTFTNIVTASVLPWLHDDECVALSDALHQINALAQVVHHVEFYKDAAALKPEPAPFLNWKRVDGSTDAVVQRISDQAWYTTPSWPALLPNDSFIGV